MDENRKKALAAALGQIEKQFGKGSVMRLGDAARIVRRRSRVHRLARARHRARHRRPAARPRRRDLRPGILGQDHAHAAGHRRSAEASAAPRRSSTPSTRSIPSYAEKLGVNVDDLLVSQPDTGEQALEIADMLVRSGAVDMVVIDSVAALTPKAEIEGEMGEPQMGLQARLMSQALRKLTGNIKRSNTMVIFINQIRMKIGVMFGNPETTTGGNALKFYASVRLDIRRIGAIKKGEEVDRQRDARQGREEQGGAAVPRGRVRHPVRRGHLARRRDHRPRRARTASSRSPAPGTATTASASARARTTRATSCKRTSGDRPARSRRRSAPKLLPVPKACDREAVRPRRALRRPSAQRSSEARPPRPTRRTVERSRACGCSRGASTPRDASCARKLAARKGYPARDARAPCIAEAGRATRLVSDDALTREPSCVTARSAARARCASGRSCDEQGIAATRRSSEALRSADFDWRARWPGEVAHGASSGAERAAQTSAPSVRGRRASCSTAAFRSPISIRAALREESGRRRTVRRT